MAQRQKTPASRHRKVPVPLAKAVGERIQSLRKDAKFTFDAFVEETGLGRGYVSELERGLVLPTIGTLAKVAKALDVTLADIVAVGDSPREQLLRLTLQVASKDLEDLVARVEKLAAKRGT